ncbi:MAG: PAS domain S-box protein [Dehalococcoidia bacterium]|nr:PAS domain S-box protein [Dehalococcoidia bacterium]
MGAAVRQDGHNEAGDVPGRAGSELEAFRWNLPDAFIEGDLQSFRVVSMNRMALILFGYTEDDLRTGISAAQVFAGDEIPRVIQLVTAYSSKSRGTDTPYQRSGRQDLYEQHFRRKDGTTFWGESQTSFVLDEHGVPYRLCTFVRDITERRQRDEAREQRIAELEAALADVLNRPALERAICPMCYRIEGPGGEWTDLQSHAVQVAKALSFEPACPDCRRVVRRQFTG